MREATGNALLTMMITSIIAVIMMFFVGSLSYSKSFKLKNYIVNVLEEEQKWSPNVQKTIDEYMKDAGYNIRRNQKNCNEAGKDINNETCTYINTNSSYDYCIYLCNNFDHNTSNVLNKYYKVVTFMKFDFPVIGKVVQFKVKGETKTFSYFNNMVN